MSIETELSTVLGGLVGGRAFPDVADFNTPRPYITWQQIGGQSINYTDNSLPTDRNAVMQINCWDDTRLGAITLALAVASALRQHPVLQIRPMAEHRANHDPDSQRYGTVQDFDIWARTIAV